MSTARHHAEWLSLVEVSGPFLSMPVLLEAFPSGLDERADATDLRGRLKLAYDEWLEDGESDKPDPAIHHAWVRYVVREMLGYSDDLLLEGQSLPANLTVQVAEHGERLSPSFAVVNDDEQSAASKPRVLVSVLPRGQAIEGPLHGARWKASPAARMMTLLHGAGVKLGLVTNGEHWMLVHGAPGETTTYASFYSELWFDEPLTLRALSSLLGTRRLFGVDAKDTLEELFRRSAENQQEVTDQLGLQVRRAVELLIQCIDRIDRDRGRRLLRGVREEELYQAAVTVMMRLVFLLCAEERKLLLLGDPLYDEHYAVSTLRDQLQQVADQHGPEVLERRYDAWSRLLATFRAVFGGVRHDSLHLPAYGGSLFDPDRYPFLEGREASSTWREFAADPLPIDNRTVLELLSAIQVLEVKVKGGGPAEARRLSFRALDVEQIGHVYEGLLDHTAKRAKSAVVSLRGSGSKEPELELAELERRLTREGEDKLVEFLEKETDRGASALKKALAYKIPADNENRWLIACDNDAKLYGRVRRFAGLVRDGARGEPVVVPEGSIYVTDGAERRTTGTHYTPRSLTEPIVQYTLEPLVYEGPAVGWPKEDWKLKSAKQLLELRVCDMAMGSGAFLVQACRYMSERLVEAWEQAEQTAGGVLVLTPEGELTQGAPHERPVPRDEDERLALARRIVTDRCLYGVDKNPMAVEMAKLSLWLVTLQKDKPFTFLDHGLKCGDSLLGLTQAAQIEHFHIDPTKGLSAEGPLMRWAAGTGPALARANELRKKLESFSVENLDDAQAKARLLAEANAAVRDASLIADLIVGAALATAGKSETVLDKQLADLLPLVTDVFGRGSTRPYGGAELAKRESLEAKAGALLEGGRSAPQPERRPFHWVLEFPEVLQRGGFDAFVGNPPFMAGTEIATNVGSDYFEYQKREYPPFGGRADLCSLFVRRTFSLAAESGCLGLVVTNSIAQGAIRRASLDSVVASGGAIYRAEPSRPWPGGAGVTVAAIHVARSPWRGEHTLDGSPVEAITSHLQAGRVESRAPSAPHRLRSSAIRASNGSKLDGAGFIIDGSEANALLTKDARAGDVVRRYLNAKMLNGTPRAQHDRYVIAYGEMPYEEAARYPAVLRVVEERVRSERQSHSEPRTRAHWWQFQRVRADLYAALATLEKTIVIPRVSKFLIAAFYDARTIFSDALVVVPSSSSGLLAVLQSGIHEVWVRKYGSSLREDLRYTPTDVFDTFPFPSTEALDSLGSAYDAARLAVQEARRIGLTEVYNSLHDPSEAGADIQEMRRLHAALDAAVARAYGWDAAEYAYAFREGRHGVRFSIDPAVAARTLERLLALNHARHAEEMKRDLGPNSVPQGQVTSRAKAATRTRKGAAGASRSRKSKQGTTQGDFDFDKTGD